MTNCKICKVISHALGKKFIMPLLGRTYPKINLIDVEPLLVNLDLEIVGGLEEHGYTINDVDVVGKWSDAVLLSSRLQKAGIINPVHYCGDRLKHSHLVCTYYGVKLALTGRGY